MIRFTRHAKNRLRRIRRDAPPVTAEAVLIGLLSGRHAGYDDYGNRKIAVDVAGVRLIVVLASDDDRVITIWRP